MKTLRNRTGPLRVRRAPNRRSLDRVGEAGRERMSRSRIASVAGLGGMALVFAATPALGAGTTYGVGPIADISASCSGQNAEVEQAADVKLGYVYETWMGCRGIAFARSTDGGRTFDTP